MKAYRDHVAQILTYLTGTSDASSALVSCEITPKGLLISKLGIAGDVWWSNTIENFCCTVPLALDATFSSA
jgi:hypothetical protein